MATDKSNLTGQLAISRNSAEKKWDLLFDEDTKEWIACKPSLGLQVYVCYSCRHMFYTKKSFLDHVNRRVALLKYNCCGRIRTFYNRCSLLLHCRKHFALDKGTINLNSLEVLALPVGMAGYDKHPDVDYLYDLEEDLNIGETLLNSYFYSPNIEDKGKELIHLLPIEMTINEAQEALALKQIAKNIPKCQFISLRAFKEMCSQIDYCVTVKSEPSDENVFKNESQRSFAQKSVSQQPKQINGSDISSSNGMNSLNISHKERKSDNVVVPVITKIETIEESENTSSPKKKTPSLEHKCTECQQECPNLTFHFLGENRPVGEKFRCYHCKLISPTECAFKAHARIHIKMPPFVCPDCGIEYSQFSNLMSHMDTICYHMTKSVRYRCPGRRCGKIFASEATFGPHFRLVHIDTLVHCKTCQKTFTQLHEYEEHAQAHNGDKYGVVKSFSCPTCRKTEMSVTQLRKHIEFHCRDLNRCIYIFMCKYCKCYFRSVQTMGTHLQNCKVQKSGLPRRIRPADMSKYITGNCKNCNNKIISLKLNATPLCNNCTIEPIPKKSPVVLKKVPVPEKCVCILCKTQIDFNERRRHQLECKYAKPHVFVEKLNLDEVNFNQSFSSSNSEFESSIDGSPHKNLSDSERPKKKHKPNKLKKLEEDDLTAEEPIQFDGTYQCRLCPFKQTERLKFHEHIKGHRHISTAYQCMECGECFVVKPSLIKHLLHYHNITDSDHYFNNNDCFDHGAINELAKVVKAPYMAVNVEENQCRVCMESFDTAQEHDTHFRIHGMAFLMKNSI
ncbi:hypothetical protein ABEB36_013194 [Hypothenemus hampei]|uniref:C2H2-type domain-containing protein n=1 Tax=Hypothenemus hampei TaxID=57062 RepID=A0ABD1E753_HYPHA